MNKKNKIYHLYQDRNWRGSILYPREVSLFEEIKENNSIIGYYRITLKKTNMLPFYTMKVTFGPVIDYSSLSAVNTALTQIKVTMKKHRVISLQINPFVWDLDLEAIRSAFIKHGFKRVDHYIYEASFIIDLNLTQEEIFSAFENRGKEAVRQSIRRGITSQKVELNENNFKSFYKLYADTCARTSMIPEKESIIRAIVDVYSATNKVFLFMAYFEEKPVCSFFAFDCGSCLSLIYQGSDYSPDIQKKRPANGLYWDTIKWAKENGFSWFDLAGVNANPLPGSKSEGIRLYKRQFGSKFVEFPGNFEFVDRPFIKFIIDKILPFYSKIALNREKLKYQKHLV